MTKHLQYFKYLVRHKYFVFVAGFDLNVSLWRLLIHDWSKFTRKEWFAYTHSFYGQQPRSQEVKDEFNYAWLHHIHWNKHHWQHWLLQFDNGELRALQMPEKYVREMVADWMGAGRAITGKWEYKTWWEKNKSVMILHDETYFMIEDLIYGD